MTCTLNPRLRAVAGLVVPGRPMADVGTDHGRLPTYLVEAGRVPWAVASDIAHAPCQVALATVAASGQRVEVRQADGLRAVQPHEVATVTMCGMGGERMMRILAAAPEVADTLRRVVVQPNSKEAELRAGLAGLGWRPVAECMVQDGGRFFLIIT